METRDLPFSALSARSKTFVVAISFVLVIESAALHALLLKRWPALSLVLVLLNAWTVWWFARDYQAVAKEPTLVRESDVLVRLGRRLQGRVGYELVDSIVRPTWQQIPANGSPGYVKLSGTDDPNVLLHLSQSVAFHGPFGIQKRGQTVGLRLDDPERFVNVVTERLAARRM